jgi:hypothetical protein
MYDWKVEVRLSSDEHRIIEQMADEENLNLVDFIKRATFRYIGVRQSGMGFGDEPTENAA